MVRMCLNLSKGIQTKWKKKKKTEKWCCFKTEYIKFIEPGKEYNEHDVVNCFVLCVYTLHICAYCINRYHRWVDDVTKLHDLLGYNEVGNQKLNKKRKKIKRKRKETKKWTKKKNKITEKNRNTFPTSCYQHDIHQYSFENLTILFYFFFCVQCNKFFFLSFSFWLKIS